MIVQESQSLFDVAIQEEGSFLAAFEWAFANGISITDQLSPGQVLIAPNSAYKNNEVANYFKARNQSIVSGYAETIDSLIPQLGIGSMRIGSTFIVR